MAPVKDTVRETKLRWFGHVKSRHVDAYVREMINLFEYRRGREQPKKIWNKVIKHDLNLHSEWRI